MWRREESMTDSSIGKEKNENEQKLAESKSERKKIISENDTRKIYRYQSRIENEIRCHVDKLIGMVPWKRKEKIEFKDNENVTKPKLECRQKVETKEENLTRRRRTLWVQKCGKWKRKENRLAHRNAVRRIRQCCRKFEVRVCFGWPKGRFTTNQELEEKIKWIVTVIVHGIESVVVIHSIWCDYVLGFFLLFSLFLLPFSLALSK